MARTLAKSGVATSLILLKSGTTIQRPVYLYTGPALSGDPTAYIFYAGAILWVQPGESVDWIEA